MSKLGSLVSFYQPPEASSTSSSTTTNTDHHPRLIILAGWTDAKEAHLLKYILKYQSLYPPLRSSSSKAL
jgi:hypothetical protein